MLHKCKPFPMFQSPFLGFLSSSIPSQASCMSSSHFNNHSVKYGAWHIAGAPGTMNELQSNNFECYRGIWSLFMLYLIHSSRQHQGVLIVILILWRRKWGFRDAVSLPKVMLLQCWEQKFNQGESGLKPTPVPPPHSAFHYMFTEPIY